MIWKDRLTYGAALLGVALLGGVVGLIVWGFFELLSYWIVHVSKLWGG